MYLGYVIASFCLILSGCGECLFPYAGCMSATDYHNYKEFWSLPLAQQKVAIRGYPPDQQLDIYRASIGIEPPQDRYFADSIAEGGTKVIPPAIDQMQHTESNDYKAALIFLLSRPGTCKLVGGNPELLNKVKQIASSIRQDSPGKADATEAIHEIETKCVPTGYQAARPSDMTRRQ